MRSELIMPKIWQLFATAESYCYLVPHDLRFFRNRFVCNAMAEEWEIPPLQLANKSKPLADFVSWMASAPVVSERAAVAIGDIVTDDVEFLPFHRIKGHRLWVINVLRCEDGLDTKRSSFEPFQERYIFKDGFAEIAPPIFKCNRHLDVVFVNSAFGAMLVDRGLKGAALADPAEPIMPLILSRSAISKFPGLTP